MFINLNWATMGIVEPSTVDDLVGLAVRHGYGGVDLPKSAYATDAAADHARRLVDNAALRWGLFWLPGSLLDSDDATFETEMRLLRDVAPRVARAGCRATYQHIWPASDTLDYAANTEFHVRRLRRMTEILWPLGIRMSLEFIGGAEIRQGRRHPFVYTLPQTLELADAVGPAAETGLGLSVDVYHWWTSGGTLSDLHRLPDIGRIVNVHLSDGVAGVPLEQQKDLVRAMPGSTGLVDIAGFLKALRDRDYDGPVICEPFDPSRTRFIQMPPDAVASEVIGIMRPLVAGAPPQ